MNNLVYIRYCLKPINDRRVESSFYIQISFIVLHAIESISTIQETAFLKFIAQDYGILNLYLIVIITLK